MTNATKEIAHWTSNLTAEQIPDRVQHEAVRCLVDWVGVTVAGSDDAAATPMLSLLKRFEGSRESTVLGTSAETNPLWAALANGYFSHLYDYDDTYMPGATTVHPSAPLWPALLALAEHQTLSGLEAIVAFVAGFETQNRIALAAGPAHYERGWHVTGTVGHFGAAAATGRALELNQDEMIFALGTAGTQAAGLKEVYGSMGKPLHPGKAAMDGLLSSLLAEEGFTSTRTILEGARGFLAVLSDSPDAAQATQGLGQDWTILDNGFKPYACGSLMHPTIEAVCAIREKLGSDIESVTEIESTVHGYVSWVTAKESPSTGLEGKFSIFHAAAVAMVDGAARLAQFTDERVNDPQVASMRDRVSITVDDDLPKCAARVRVTTTDGRVLDHEVSANKGTRENPMSDEELHDKALDLVAPVIGTTAAQGLLTACWNLSSAQDFGALARATRGEK